MGTSQSGLKVRSRVLQFTCVTGPLLPSKPVGRSQGSWADSTMQAETYLLVVAPGSVRCCLGTCLCGGTLHVYEICSRI